jgi:uncharacterized protein (DUF58 family)
MDLSATRELSRTSASSGEPVECTLTIRNNGGPLFNLQLVDGLFPSMKILDGEGSCRLSLAVGSSAQLRYTFETGRGVYPFTSLHARASNPFGLFVFEKHIPALAELLVRPTTLKFRHSALKPGHTLHTAGPIPARLAGSGCDFWGVREYRPGDSLHHINWQMRARHPGELFTNEYEREEIADFGLVLDARRLTDAEAAESALFESSISAAASVSEVILKGGNRLSLLVFGKTTQVVFPGCGKRQRYLVLRGLARAEMGRNLPMSYLEYMPARLFPSRSILVIFSTLGTDDLGTYSRLRAMGHEVLLVSPDPIDLLSRKMPRHGRVDAFALRLARLERRLLLGQLARLGVRLVDWQVDQPLEQVVRRLIRELNHRRSALERVAA